MQKDMNKIMQEELIKLRYKACWIWNRYVTPENLSKAKLELRYSRCRYKIQNIYDKNGKLKGHNIYVYNVM